MSLLVLAPHPDDEAIGPGGTIALAAARGERVVVVFLTSGELGLEHLPREEAWRVREHEAAAAAGVLGLARLHFLCRPDWFLGEEVAAAARLLAPILREEAPAQVYLPHPEEEHPDHRAALPVLRRALEEAGISRPATRTYEVWTPLSRYDAVEDVTPAMARKLHAVRCYRSQLAGFRYDRAVRGLNQYRGCLAARCRYAEVFGEVDLQPDPFENEKEAALAWPH
jgi:LmbE family N-acetylglucosaminyl deacetylase